MGSARYYNDRRRRRDHSPPCCVIECTNEDELAIRGEPNESTKDFAQCPVPESHTRHNPSQLNETIRDPSQLKSTVATGSELAVITFHNKQSRS